MTSEPRPSAATPGPPDSPNPNKDLWHAIGQSALGRYSTYVASLVSVVVLARLFSPEDFGAIASVQVIYTLGLLLSESGFGPALVNEARLERRDRDGVFTLTVLTGLVLGLATVAATPSLERFYGNEALGSVTPWLALSLVAASASVVPIAALHRDQRFVQLGVSDSLAELASTVVAVVLLVLAPVDQVVALAVRMPIRTGLRWGYLYMTSAGTEIGQPTLGGGLAGIRRMLRFASSQFAFNLVTFVSRNVDTVLVGRYLGPSALGVYDRTYQLMRYPLLLVTFAISPAIQPVLRRHAGELATMEAVHRALVWRLAYAGVAASLALVLGADLAVRIVLGPGWEETVPLLRILAVAIPLQIVSASSGGFYQALGNPPVMLLTGSASAVIMTLATVAGIGAGDLSVLAWSLVAGFHASFIANYALLHAYGFRRSMSGLVRALMLPSLAHVFVLVIAVVTTRA